MAAIISTALIGAVICFLGITNMRGDISSLHRYHRHRVAEENVKPFGRLVGLGTLIAGVSVVAFSLFLLALELTGAEFLSIVGTVILFVGIAVGTGISFYAMKKYNGGIF